jgi:hypothetical protein
MEHQIINMLTDEMKSNRAVHARSDIKYQDAKYFEVMTKNVNEVTEIKLEVLKRNPLVLVISCKGNVISPGWTNAQLIPFVYVTPPSDGLYEFDFVATEPIETQTDVITDVRAQTFFWEDYPSELGGVKIYTTNNMMIEEL